MPRLPILVYQHISPLSTESKGKTLSKEKLEAQFAYIKANEYQTLHFSELQELHSPINYPKKAVILTFDNAYQNQLEFAYPLLKKYDLKATFFVPFQYVGGVDAWQTNEKPVMSLDQLKTMDPEIIQLGLRSFANINFKETSVEKIIQDFEQSKTFVRQNDLDVANVLAYPQGKYPRKNPAKKQFFEILAKQQISYALRLGNRVNKFPFKNNYEIQRIEINGEDSFTRFKFKLRYGKVVRF